MKKILLIAGPSGAGKTTFLNLVKTKSLPDKIIKVLPTDLDQWPVFEANNLSRDIISCNENHIVHYDTVDLRRYPELRYETDPRLDLLLDCDVNALWVITLSPAPKQLAAQFQRRNNLQKQQKALLKRAWSNVRKLLSRCRTIFSNSYKYHDREMLYASPSAIEHFQNRWLDYLILLEERAKPEVKFLTLRPTTASDKENLSFEIV